MKKIFFLAAAALLMASCSDKHGSVTIKLPEGFQEPTLVVSHTTIENLTTATKSEDVRVIFDTLQVKKGVAKLSIDSEGPARYQIIAPFITRTDPEFYATPNDVLEVNISSFEPLNYDTKGSQLMEDLTAFSKITVPIQQEYIDFVSDKDSVPEEPVKAIWDRYDKAIKDFVKNHPQSPAIPLVIMELNGDDFKVLYDNMTPEAKNSILMPFAEGYNRNVEEMLNERYAEEARKAEVASGTITAPDFTLPNLAGKNVSLSDFRGKWVVLDFWGTWCGWCVKGFPALKDAYAKYGDKIVIIGIDCNEPESDWRAGVKKYELPWLNLYNGNNKDIYMAYNIEGFPTKAIINPEGKLVDLTTGEDATFYDRLANFVEL